MPGTVLIADDEEAIRDLCRVSLELEGFDVLEAPDGEVAVEIARHSRPGVIFLDLGMPRRDGWDTLDVLQHDDVTAAIPVVLLTARHADDDQVRGWERGILDYITKPFHPRDLVAAARRAVGPRDPVAEHARRQGVLDELVARRELRRRRADLRSL